MIELVVELARCEEKPVEHDPVRMRPADSEVDALLADRSGLAAATSWRPKVDLRCGFMRTIAWWRNRLSFGSVRREHEFIA